MTSATPRGSARIFARAGCRTTGTWTWWGRIQASRWPIMWVSSRCTRRTSVTQPSAGAPGPVRPVARVDDARGRRVADHRPADDVGGHGDVGDVVDAARREAPDAPGDAAHDVVGDGDPRRVGLAVARLGRQAAAEEA